MFFGSVHTRDESPIGRLQQNLEQIGGSPARVVVSAAFLSSLIASSALSPFRPLFLKRRHGVAAVWRWCYKSYCSAKLVQMICSIHSLLSPQSLIHGSSAEHIRHLADAFAQSNLRLFIHSILPWWKSAATQGADQHIRSGLGVQFLARQHFDMQTRGVKPATLR